MKFVIYGEPVSKGRPRFSNRGGFIKTYTPQKTQAYENLVKLSYQQQVKDMKFLEGNLRANITAYFSIPQSISLKKKEQLKSECVHVMKKPDCDNIAKIILDSLNKIAYDDDKQVVQLCVEKFYSDTPRVEVELLEVV